MLSKKKINIVGLNVEGEVDADDMGHRLVDCVETLSPDVNVVNIVKIALGNDIRSAHISRVVEECVVKPLREMGATNCIFVPLVPGVIEDIKVDRIEVITNESDN